MKVQQFLKTIALKSVEGFKIALVGVALALSVGLLYPATAFAAPTMIADLSDIQQEAKEAFDSVFGAGTSDRVEGNIDQSIGEAKKQAGKVKSQFDDNVTAGVGDRVEGQFDKTVGAGKEQVGKAKGFFEDVLDRAEMKGEQKASSIESVIQEKLD
ncbi:MAG: hypothetical protein SAJ12_16255 [Jaaginema sp. PMC 1079.18]|nr:hypothetical protein [Jaaginema sp. PMC 1080.18]MEC4852537.1 hypothetical protein [Jaaginema sp. PMC 1079.18]MEC4865653.1 hypothetical protein [Jaaginema sp. PMC 1078.18]